MREITVKTGERQCWVDVTGQIAEDLPADARAVLVFSPHTTAGVTINENADPDVQSDFFAKLSRLVPKSEAFFRHAEGNSDSHILTSLVGTQALIPVENGKLQLGTWQGVYLCEFDGPRTRRLLVQYL